MTSELNVKDVCDIIQKCADCGVGELKFGPLELKFHQISVPVTTSGQNPAPHIEEPSQGPENDAPTMSPELLKKIEEDIKQDQLAEMLITDPAQFEELIFSGEVVNDDEARGTEPTL